MSILVNDSQIVKQTTPPLLSGEGAGGRGLNKPKNIIIGQKVSAEKVKKARALRKQMTPEESLLWQQLRGNRLYGKHFRRQQVIKGFIVDFYCHSDQLVVEVDGAVHQGNEERDAMRDRILREMGLQVIRFKNEEIRNDIEGVTRRILEACKT